MIRTARISRPIGQRKPAGLNFLLLRIFLAFWLDRPAENTPRAMLVALGHRQPLQTGHAEC